jgi:hypothetical protein
MITHPIHLPDTFVTPTGFTTETYTVRMLTINDVVKDYEAVVTSIDHLQGIFGSRIPLWPSKDITLEEDLIALGWHQLEFQKRTSFAYTIMSQDERECIGCLYFFPSEKEGFDVDVYFWLRTSTFAKGLDPVIFTRIKSWIRHEWPFTKVAYPGRDISWTTWKSLK